MTIDGTSVVKVAEIEGRGRGMVASQLLRAGQVVLRDSPILLYSALPFIKQPQDHFPNSLFCDHCFKLLCLPQSSVTQCSCCSHHVFCSPNCLTLAQASSHSPWVCHSMTRLRSCCSAFLNQPPERQIQARFLIAAFNLALVSPSDFQILLSLHGLDSPSDAATAHFLHSLISSLCISQMQGGGEFPSFSLELTAALLAKDKLNAFGLMEPFSFPDQQGQGQRSVRAYGIYPMASFFNHDCLPNACRFDYVDSATDHNTDIIIRMIHDVSQGREICLSYFPVNLGYSSRQKRLLGDYGFTCDCDRCKVEANWSDDENDDQEGIAEEVMDEDEDEDQQMAAEDGPVGGDSDFPHAYFFLRYMCNRENCWGTLAPLPPSDATPSSFLECNVCGNLKQEEDIDGDQGDGNSSMDD